MAKRFAGFEKRAMMVRPICPPNIQKENINPALRRWLIADHEPQVAGFGKGGAKERMTHWRKRQNCAKRQKAQNPTRAVAIGKRKVRMLGSAFGLAAYWIRASRPGL